MFKERSKEHELMDDARLCGKELMQNLREIEFTNHWLGSESCLRNAFKRIINKCASQFKSHEIEVVDLGCGNGDLLRSIENWLHSQKMRVQLLGVDINPFMIHQARLQSLQNSEIDYQVLDVLSSETKQLEADIFLLNSFTHHLNDEEFIKLLKQLKAHAHIAIIINDLQRHWVSYYAIRILTKLARFSKLAIHDGPLSVLKAFHREELEALLNKAGIIDFEIHWYFAFRWQVIIWC